MIYVLFNMSTSTAVKLGVVFMTVFLAVNVGMSKPVGTDTVDTSSSSSDTGNLQIQAGQYGLYSCPD